MANSKFCVVGYDAKGQQFLLNVCPSRASAQRSLKRYQDLHSPNVFKIVSFTVKDIRDFYS